jgi:hypothetical protein
VYYTICVHSNSLLKHKYSTDIVCVNVNKTFRHIETLQAQILAAELSPEPPELFIYSFSSKITTFLFLPSQIHRNHQRNQFFQFFSRSSFSNHYSPTNNTRMFSQLQIILHTTTQLHKNMILNGALGVRAVNSAIGVLSF